MSEISPQAVIRQFVQPPMFVETRDSVRHKLWSGEYLTREHGGRSSAWKSFLAIIGQDGKLVKYVTCKTCGDVFSYKGHSSGTSTLRKHLNKCHKEEQVEYEFMAFSPNPKTCSPPDFLEVKTTEASSGGSAYFDSSFTDQQMSSSELQDTSCDAMSVALSPEQILGEEEHSESALSPTIQRPESYKLSHNNHLSIVLEALAVDESFMDVTLTAQGRSIKAHKSVLSAVSPYFRSVLKANPCQHPIIIMPRDISFEELKNIVIYIYRGEMTVSADDLSSLLKTAETLQISGLSPSESPNEPTNAVPTHQQVPKKNTLLSGSKRSSPPKYPPTKKRRLNTPVEPSPSPGNTVDEPPVQDTDQNSDDGNIVCVKEEIESDVENEDVASSVPEMTICEDQPSSPTLSTPTPDDPNHTFETEEVDLSPNVCPFCSETFESQKQTATHLNKQHPNESFDICKCGRVYKNPIMLEDHRKKCHTLC